MKSYIVGLFLLFYFSLPQKAQTLSEGIGALLADELLQKSDVSLAVYDLDADSLLYAHRQHKLCRPASVLKLVTSYVAISRLGTDYTFDTSIYGNESGDAHNLYVKGCIDPLFDEDDILAFVSAVPKGIVVDTLYADCSYMDSLYWGPGWAWDDTPWGFQPYISPLMLCGGCVEVTVTPTAAGESPIVESLPVSSFYSVVNEAVSGKGEKLSIMRDWLEGGNVIRVTGSCSVEKSERMNLYPSQDFFLAVLRERIEAAGVEVRNISFSHTPLSATLLHTVSRPIAEVVGEALLESDNLCAEALCYHLGGTYGYRPVRQEMGPKIIESFLEYELGFSSDFNVADGSGLSPYSYISADIILDLLIRINENREAHDIVMAGLPQAGISGTMKHRMKSGAAYKNVFAKTGTVKGVCTLAGYAKAANGHTLAFVIMNQGVMNSSEARQWQDKVCNLLCK